MKDFIQEKWEEEFADEFCVMFERADREENYGESGNVWKGKCIAYIDSLLSSTLTEYKEKLVGEIAGMKSHPKEYHGECKAHQHNDGYNQAILDILKVLDSKAITD